MLSAVAEKPKKPGKRGRPPGRKETFVIQARVEWPLYEALEKLSAETRRTKNAELVLALEQYLQGLGKWPPPDHKPGKP